VKSNVRCTKRRRRSTAPAWLLALCATGETAQVAPHDGDDRQGVRALQSLRAGADDKAFAAAVEGLIPVVASSSPS